MKTLLKTLLVTAGILIAGFALAADHGPDRKGHRGAPGMDLPLVEHLGKALRRLDLSVEQEEGFRAEIRAMREQIRPLMEQMHAGRRELHGLVTAEAYDAEAVSALAAEQGNLTAEITMIASDAVSAVLAQLTEEQRSELAAMGEKRRAQREDFMERRRDRLCEPPGEE